MNGGKIYGGGGRRESKRQIFTDFSPDLIVEAIGCVCVCVNVYTHGQTNI